MCAIEKRLTKQAAANTPAEENWGRQNANCYAWAANCPEPVGANRAEPGAKSGYAVKENGLYMEQLLVNAVIRDGMAFAGGDQAGPPADRPGHYLVALYISDDQSDFHWYRRDPMTLRWTHKPGPHGVRNFGKDFAILPTSLATANHNYGTRSTNYRFVAYFHVPIGGITIATL